MSRHIGARVIKQEIKGLQALSTRLDAKFDAAVEALRVSGKIILTGVGKSGHVARKLAATMTSLGSPAVYMHPTEAAHGDMGFLGNNDAVIALSRSGKASELEPLLAYAATLNAPTVLISENADSGLALLVDVVLKLPRVDEAWGHAPTTSTVMQMGIGDALAISLAEERGFTVEDFKRTHPGGDLGR